MATSPARRSELHVLTTRNGFIPFSHNGIFLLPDPSFLTKNETAYFTPGKTYLPSIALTFSITEDRKVYPGRALKWYLERTQKIRSSEKLFLIPRCPYRPVSKDTLFRWIVSLISPHANNSEAIHAHYLRAHASSKAWFDGVGLSDILKAAV